MDKEQQDKLREIADQMDVVRGRGDSYKWLIRLITFGSLPDTGKALANFASAVGQDSMSLEERKQAFMDVFCGGTNENHLDEMEAYTRSSIWTKPSWPEV